MKLRIAAFNVENLFSRPRVLNLADHDTASGALKTIAKLQRELEKPRYDKPRILELYDEIDKYVRIRGDRERFWASEGHRIRAGGRKDVSVRRSASLTSRRSADTSRPSAGRHYGASGTG